MRRPIVSVAQRKPELYVAQLWGAVSWKGEAGHVSTKI